MSGDRSTRNALAALLLVAALFVAMNLLISAAPLLDWWLPLVLVVLGLALVFVPNIGLRAAPDVASSDVDPAAPRLSATVHDYEAAEYAAPALEAVLPFPESSTAVPSTPRQTPVSPETPAPLVEPEPQADVPPMSPETPAPAAEPEPEAVPASPETPTPEVPTEVLDEAASQALPTSHAPDTGKPAPELKHSSRTEYANPDEAVSKREPKPAPPADDSVTATDHSQPEKVVVAEKTSAPQQPYEAEQVGEITPERTERVMDGGDDSDAPLVTESASSRVAAQEINGEGSVGSGEDLTKIDGVGPKSAAALRAAGIDSFQKLANSSPDAVRDALTGAGVRLVGDVDSWAHQAGYAARGDWAGLETFNSERKTRKG